MRTRLTFGIGVVTLTAFVLASATLTACGTASATETAIENPAPDPQITMTSPPALATTGRPTETPTATSKPKPQIGPEQPAVSIEQVAGSWLIRIPWSGDGALTFEQDGTYSSIITSGGDAGMQLEDGTYHFEGDVLVLITDWCIGSGISGEPFTCTATYHVFVAMQGDKPGSLRFALIEDPVRDREEYLSRTLLPAPQE